MKKLTLFLMVLAIVMVLSAPVMADVTPGKPELHVQSTRQMRSSTATTVDISATNKWTAGANSSVYTTAFTFNGAKIDQASVYLSTTAVNSGSHILTIEGSDDGTTFGVFTEATSVSVTAGTTTAPIFGIQTRAKATIAATGDIMLIFRNIPRAAYYRFHLNADASNGPFEADKLSITRY